jgi:predicted NAD-dependent protein-ADP-ribosyltransferase YbiA (DUF1768 family)
MMYRKALTFSDKETAKEIMLTSSPRKCKTLGRATKGFDEKIWNKHKFQGRRGRQLFKVHTWYRPRCGRIEAEAPCDRREGAGRGKSVRSSVGHWLLQGRSQKGEEIRCWKR